MTATLRFVADVFKTASWSVGMGLIAARYLGMVVLNEVWWTLLVASLTSAPAIVSIIRREAPRRCLLWIVVMSISLRAVVPLTQGSSSFMIGADAIYHFQVAEIYSTHAAWTWGLETERAVSLVFFPVLQILSMQISTVSALQLYPVCRFLPLILSVPLLMIVFAAYARMLGPRIAVYASFLFSVCYKYNWFDGYYIQESLGIFFFVMVFYFTALKVMRAQRNRAPVVAIFLGASALAMTHFFSALLLSLTLVLWGAGSFVIKRLSPVVPRIRATDIVPVVVIFFSWLVFVAVGPFVTGIHYATDYSSTLAQLIRNPFGLNSVPEPTGIHLTTQEAAVVYGGFLVAGGVGIFSMARGIRALRTRDNSKERQDIATMLALGAIAILLGVPAAAGMFLSAPTNYDIPSRFVTFVYLLWSPAFGVGIWLTRKRLNQLFSKRTCMLNLRVAVVSLCIASLLILPVASTWLLLPSTMRGQTTLDDQEVTALSSWLSTQGDKSSALMGDDTMTIAAAALARQSIIMGFLPPPYNGARFTGMLYYAEKTTPLTRYLSTEPRAYILVNKMYLSHKYYVITYLYEGRPPPSQVEMETSWSNLSNLPMVNAVYSSGAIILYASYP